MWLRRNSNSEWKLCAAHYCDRRINTNQSCPINCKYMWKKEALPCGRGCLLTWKIFWSVKQHPNHAEPTSLG